MFGLSCCEMKVYDINFNLGFAVYGNYDFRYLLVVDVGGRGLLKGWVLLPDVWCCFGCRVVFMGLLRVCVRRVFPGMMPLRCTWLGQRYG